jgi:3-hydroxy-9,10-secoandrosta-1,3,5(10)-triene-9,17-dione monooxygenase reductase component
VSEFGAVIENATAWIGCTLHSLHSAGDHHIVIGAIGAAEATGKRPLLRHDANYH